MSDNCGVCDNVPTSSPTTKERFQTPVQNDTLVLRLLALNRNMFANVQSIDHVDIFYHDPALQTDVNRQGKRLVQTITDINQADVGQYNITFPLTAPLYTLGVYSDNWHLNFRDDQESCIEQYFRVYADQWFTTPTPLYYDFDFKFQPNRMVHGEKKFIQIVVTPNVPRASDLIRFYEGLVANSSLAISIAAKCGPCIPAEQDLRIIVDNAPVTNRENNTAFYWIDTTDMDCGIYDVWFSLCFGGNVFISSKNQLQVFS